MAVLTINTRKQFENWLADNDDFADARVPSLAPVPKSESSSVPSELTIELAFQIEGNHKAHSTRVSRVFRVRATDIAEYRLAADGAVSPEHWSEGIEILESGCPIAFEIDVPAVLTLCCSQISVEELPNLTETVTPWLSDREVFAKIPATSMLTPTQWQMRFNDLDQDVVWHTYHGGPMKTEEVPIPNYEGWFLQTRKDVNESHQGILFLSCQLDGNGFRLQIQNQGASNSLWQAAMITLAGFDTVEIHCGNCELSGTDFLREWNNWNKAQQCTGANRQ